MTGRVRLLSVLLLAACAALAQAGDMRLAVDRQHGAVTVDAQGVPLTLLLRRLANRADFTLRMDPAVDHPVTVAANGQALDTFLNDLARREKLSLVVSWTKGPGGKPRISGIAVLPPGQTDASRLPVAHRGGKEGLAERKQHQAEAKAERQRQRLAKKAAATPAPPTSPPD